MYIASLPWYDLDEIRSSNDELWRQLSRRLRRRGLSGVPRELTRDLHYEQQWNSPEFLFGQACGYDLTLAFPDQLQLLATPRYNAPGCRGGHYSSFIVVRDAMEVERLDELRGTRCVINTLNSHSGMNILRAIVSPLHVSGRFFSNVMISGSHDASLRMIMRGEADVAAIDCVTYALFERYRPQLHAGTRILCETEHVLSPPFVTSSSMPADVVNHLRESLAETFNDPALASVKEDLMLDGIDFLPLESYRPIAKLESVAREHGYSEITCLTPRAVKTVDYTRVV